MEELRELCKHCARPTKESDRRVVEYFTLEEVVKVHVWLGYALKEYRDCGLHTYMVEAVGLYDDCQLDRPLFDGHL